MSFKTWSVCTHTMIGCSPHRLAHKLTNACMITQEEPGNHLVNRLAQTRMSRMSRPWQRLAKMLEGVHPGIVPLTTLSSSS